MKRSQFLGALAACVVGSGLGPRAHAAPSARAPLRILPIGDSITQGGRLPKEYTYRWQLARLLTDDDIAYQFIGTRHRGLDPAFRWPQPWSDAHEGYYGGKTRAVVDQVLAHLPLLPPPDIAITYLGTNDGPPYGDSVITPLIELVAGLRVRNPRVAVLIGRVPKPILQGAIALELRFDQLARMATPESPIVVVPIDEGWVSDPHAAESDTLDGVHPNLRGQRKMAEAWLLAIRQLVALGRV